MIQGVPVIAIDNAGPKETIEHESTGFLLPNDAKEWSQKMRWMVERDLKTVTDMQEFCIQRMLNYFEFKNFAKHFLAILSSLTSSHQNGGKGKFE